MQSRNVFVQVLSIVTILGFSSAVSSADHDRATCEYSQGTIIASPVAISEDQAKSIIAESSTEMRGSTSFFCQCMSGILSDKVTKSTREDLVRLVLRESRHLDEREGLESLVFDCIYAANNSHSIRLTVELGAHCCSKKAHLLRCLHNSLRDNRILLDDLMITTNIADILIERKIASPDDVINSLLPIVAAVDVDCTRRFIVLGIINRLIFYHTPGLVAEGDACVSNETADETGVLCAMILTSKDCSTVLRERAAVTIGLLTVTNKREIPIALCDRAVEIFLDSRNDDALRAAAIRMLASSATGYRGLPFEDVYLLVESDSVFLNSPAFYSSLVDFIVDRGIRTDREVAVLENALKQVGQRSRLGKKVFDALAVLRNGGPE